MLNRTPSPMKLQKKPIPVTQSKAFVSLVLLIFMLLSFGVGNGNAMPNQAEQSSCTVYIPPENTIDDSLDAQIVEGVQILNDPNGMLNDAISTFNDVIKMADLDDPRSLIAKNNLLCTYLKLVSIQSRSVIVATPDPEDKVPSTGACAILEEARRLKSELQQYYTLGTTGLPDIPRCGIEFDMSTNVSMAFYPVNITFVLPPKNISQAQVDNTDIHDISATTTFTLEGHAPIPAQVPVEDVYCYKFEQIDNAPLQEPQWRPIHMENGDEYTTVEESNNWILQESSGKYELIFADILEDSENAKEIHITTSDNKQTIRNDYTIMLNRSFNQADSRAIKANPGEKLEIKVTEVITSVTGERRTYQGEDILYTINTGQIYTIQEISDQIFMNEISCDTYLDADKSPIDFGIETLDYGSLVEGEVSSRSGNLWKFTGNAGDSVVLTMNSNDITTALYVYTSSGYPLSPFYSTNGSYNSQILFNLPDNDDYYIVAKGGDGAPGHYTLRLQKDESCQIALKSLGGKYNQIEYYDSLEGFYIDQDYSEQWVFCGYKGESVTIRMASSTINSRLQLYSSDYRVGLLAINNNQEAECTLDKNGYFSEGCNATINYGPLPQTGLYIIEAGCTSGSGGYTLYLGY